MKISVDLKNCYGIKSLTHKFDFSEGNSIILYFYLIVNLC